MRSSAGSTHTRVPHDCRWLQVLQNLAGRTLLGVSVRSLIELLLGAALAWRFFVKLRSTRGHVVWDWHITSVLQLEAVFVIALLLLVAHG